MQLASAWIHISEQKKSAQCKEQFNYLNEQNINLMLTKGLWCFEPLTQRGFKGQRLK